MNTSTMRINKENAEKFTDLFKSLIYGKYPKPEEEPRKPNTHTNWSSPKTNIIAGMNDLRGALASGYNARLIRLRNEDCSYPIKVKKENQDFRNYKFSSGHMSTRQQILDDRHMTEFEKHLTLNYKACYGTPEAVKRYYDTGELCEDNFNGMGTCHLVKVHDMVEFYDRNLYESGGDMHRANIFREQYITLETANERHFYDFFSYKHGSPWAIKEFRRKLWVVELLKKDEPKASVPLLVHVLNVLAYPLKFIPERSVLKMKEYKCVTLRLGGVINGFSVEFHIPKKFGFKDN